MREYRTHPAISDMPIIVLSTKEEPLIKSEAFAAGANDYLVKLPDKIELVARIRYHSRAYMTLLQRDEAYRALRESQQQLLDTNLELQRLTNFDGLTGLSNRRHFDEYLELEWRRAMRDQSQIVAADDRRRLSSRPTTTVLAIWRVTKPCARSPERSATCAAVRPTCRRVMAVKSSHWCCRVPRRVVHDCWRKNCVSRWPRSASHNSPVPGSPLTISIGLATHTPQHGSSARQMILDADNGLYQAKNNGRNQVVVGVS